MPLTFISDAGIFSSYEKEQGTFTMGKHKATTYPTISVKPENCNGLPVQFSTDWSGWVTLQNLKREDLNGKQARYVGFNSESGRAHVRVFKDFIHRGAQNFPGFFN